MSGMLFAAVTALVGWVALWPARRRLGAWAYFTFSWPLGLLAWPVAAAACSLIGVPLRLPWLGIGAALFCAASFAAFRLAAGGDDGKPVAWWSFALHLCAVLAVAAAAAKLHVFFATDDSWYGYETVGVLLFDTGRISVQLATSRNLLIPAMHAVHRALGGDLLVAAYPVTAAHLVSGVALAAWRVSFAKFAPAWRASAAAAVALAFAVSDQVAFHALYVHSHMLTATYLLLGVLALVLAREAGKDAEGPWMVAAGLAAAGVALARPDGLTYAFVLVALALAGLLESGLTPRRAAAFFVPLLTMLVVSFAAILAATGMFVGDKLTATAALAQIAAMAALPALALALLRYPPLAARLTAPGTARRLAIALSVVAVAVVAAVRRRDFLLAVRTMAVNLLVTGGWGRFWLFAASVAIVALAFPALRRRSPASSELGYVAAQFLLIALVVHGLAHPGRLGPADSFNRIAFHLVPIVWWYAASLLSFSLRETAGSAILDVTAEGDAAETPSAEIA